MRPEETVNTGLDGVVATSTSVSCLDTVAEQIVVRGYDLIDLATHVEYLDVAHLLLVGSLPSGPERTAFAEGLWNEMALPKEVEELLRLIPREMAPMDSMRTALSFLAGYDADLRENSESANREKGLRVLAKLPLVVAHGYRLQNGLRTVVPDRTLGYSGNFLYLLTGEAPSPEAAELFDMTLSCYSEHELPNSTFTARVIASTLSDIYGAMVGAVASLKGPLHGGANEAAAEMLTEIGDPSGARAYVLDKLKRKERIMGFGHRVYMRRIDPRAALLEDHIEPLANAVSGGSALLETYRVVAQTMREEKGLHPNADFPIGLIYHLLGIPRPLYTPIFFVARSAGLCAHVIEQHATNRLYRPRAQYEGPRGLRVENTSGENVQ